MTSAILRFWSESSLSSFCAMPRTPGALLQVINLLTPAVGGQPLDCSDVGLLQAVHGVNLRL